MGSFAFVRHIAHYSADPTVLACVSELRKNHSAVKETLTRGKNIRSVGSKIFKSESRLLVFSMKFGFRI